MGRKVVLWPMTKTCFKCGEAKPTTEFYRHPQMADGLLGKCKTCTKRDVRERYDLRRVERLAYERERNARPERREQMRATERRQREKHPERYRARYLTTNAIRDGRLVRQPCEACGTTERVQAHHDDYSRPLEVRWLCVMDHKRLHGHTRH